MTPEEKKEFEVLRKKGAVLFHEVKKARAEDPMAEFFPSPWMHEKVTAFNAIMDRMGLLDPSLSKKRL